MTAADHSNGGTLGSWSHDFKTVGLTPWETETLNKNPKPSTPFPAHNQGHAPERKDTSDPLCGLEPEMAFNKGGDTTWLMHCRIIKPRPICWEMLSLIFLFLVTGIKYKYTPLPLELTCGLDCSVSWSLFQRESCVCLLEWLQERQTSASVITAIKHSRYHRQGLTYKDFKRPLLKSKIITIAPHERFEFGTLLQWEDGVYEGTAASLKPFNMQKVISLIIVVLFFFLLPSGSRTN